MESVRLLQALALKTGGTETDVVEYCVARYACAMEVNVEAARGLLTRQIARSIATPSAGDGSRSSSQLPPPHSDGGAGDHKVDTSS